jgi:hypothetical protein
VIKKIQGAIDKFNLNLLNRNVLTEAATGNFVVTPIIAALAGANVIAFTKATRYGSFSDVASETFELAKKVGVVSRIRVVGALDDVSLEKIDIVTNTGHLRPINADFISRLSASCVIPLMWEPWEYRDADLDLHACVVKGIKVYGTNEEDRRLRTKDYIGYLVLSILLQNKFSPFSANILLVGGDRFVTPVSNVLANNGYSFESVSDYSNYQPKSEDSFNVIVLLEHEQDSLLIDAAGKLFGNHIIDKGTFVIHICGNMIFPNKNINFFPKQVRPFGYMSLTPDLVDPKCVVDLHTAGLKVAEGMLTANCLGLSGLAYKQYMESNYPALAFDNAIYW